MSIHPLRFLEVGAGQDIFRYLVYAGISLEATMRCSIQEVSGVHCPAPFCSVQEAVSSASSRLQRNSPNILVVGIKIRLIIPLLVQDVA